jgi:hypothetical protein
MDHEIFTSQDSEQAKAEIEAAELAYQDVLNHEKTLNR